MTPFLPSDLHSDITESECPLPAPLCRIYFIPCYSPYLANLSLSHLLPPHRYLCICCLSPQIVYKLFEGRHFACFIHWCLPTPWSCTLAGLGAGISICGTTTRVISKPWSPRSLCARECARCSALTSSCISPDNLVKTPVRREAMADRGWATEPQSQPRRPRSSAHVLPASVRAVADYKEAEGHVLITITVRPRVAMKCPLRHHQHCQAAGWLQQGCAARLPSV